MKLDSEGFYRPIIDTNKCAKCGLCERTCPWTNIVANPNHANNTPKTLAAFAKDESIRLESSSGGIFTVLAKKILDEGGIVAGVAQITPTRFGHIIIDNKTDLIKLRGSKYVQADVGLVYRKICTLLKSGRKVLFSGTPCQVAALYAVLGSKVNTPNLYTVDIVCHGTPSVKVFEKYVEEIEQKQHDSLQKIFFRDKKNGWNVYSLTHLFKSGKM
jgi:coenzyme F420-reducing hydrogenase beta subunit